MRVSRRLQYERLMKKLDALSVLVHMYGSDGTSIYGIANPLINMNDFSSQEYPNQPMIHPSKIAIYRSIGGFLWMNFKDRQMILRQATSEVLLFPYCRGRTLRKHLIAEYKVKTANQPMQATLARRA